MTVIAFRSGVLAADTLALNGAKTRQSKLRRLKDGRLVGFAGVFVDAIEYVKYLDGERDDMPEWMDNGGCSALIVTREGVVEHYEDGKGPIIIQEEFAAIGSGAQFAYGAMHMGATAEQAVEAAIKWASGCGGEVEMMRVVE